MLDQPAARLDQKRKRGINLLNRSNCRFDSFGGYNAKTGRATVTLDRMFPIIPSIGVVLEFEGR